MAREPTVSDETTDEDLAMVIGLDAPGESTLGQAGERADVSQIEMREVLVEAGIQPRPGPETEAEARGRSGRRWTSRESLSLYCRRSEIGNLLESSRRGPTKGR